MSKRVFGSRERMDQLGRVLFWWYAVAALATQVVTGDVYASIVPTGVDKWGAEVVLAAYVLGPVLLVLGGGFMFLSMGKPSKIQRGSTLAVVAVLAAVSVTATAYAAVRVDEHLTDERAWPSLVWTTWFAGAGLLGLVFCGMVLNHRRLLRRHHRDNVSG